MTIALDVLSRDCSLFLLGLLLLIWMWISRLSFYFFTTTTVNRFRFRYWSSISILNLFHLVLAIVYKFNNDSLLQSLRFQTFFLIDILLLEVFIHKVTDRQKEILTRAIFYFSAIMFSFTDWWFFGVINGFILLALSSHTVDDKLRVRYAKVFLMYIAAMTAPYWHLSFLAENYEGFTNLISLTVGFIYSSCLAHTIYTLYRYEKIEEKIKQSNREGGE